MEILAGENEWLPTDEERLAALLDSDTGKRLIKKLAENIPLLLEGGKTNAILIRSGEVRAHHKLVETLYFLAHPPAPMPAPVVEYPRLEDDSAWNDGQKLLRPDSTSATPEPPKP